jgi:hypothetical protein
MLKKIAIILIFIASFPLSAQASDSWTKNEIIKQGLYGLVVVIDAKQTQQGIQSGQYREGNPFMGEYPSNREINQHLLSVFIAHTLIANYLDTDNRKMFQDVSLIIGVTNISRNHMIGARINF